MAIGFCSMTTRRNIQVEGKKGEPCWKSGESRIPEDRHKDQGKNQHQQNRFPQGTLHAFIRRISILHAGPGNNDDDQRQQQDEQNFDHGVQTRNPYSR